jgi:hypothetical protein
LEVYQKLGFELAMTKFTFREGALSAFPEQRTDDDAQNQSLAFLISASCVSGGLLYFVEMSPG